MEIYRAGKEHTEQLKRLACDSEAHWGYDHKFMEIFGLKYNITEDFINANPVYVAADSQGMLGFWGIRPRGNQWELEYFYIDSSRLNSGYGRFLWEHMTAWCRENYIKELEFVTSPQATGFYEKMGAVSAGVRPSVIDGRPVPVLRYTVDCE